MVRELYVFKTPAKTSIRHWNCQDNEKQGMTKKLSCAREA